MRLAAAAALACLTLAGVARADGTVTIGAIYPFAHEPDARLVLEVGAEIINAPHAGLESLPLGGGHGLPHLNGATLAIDFADDLANPAVAEGQALRLVAQDHVAALLGAGGAPQTLAATALAERRQIPFLVPDATAPAITGRGLKWVFRTTPLAADDAKAYAQFLAGLKTGGSKLNSVAVVFDDDDVGRAAAAPIRTALTAAGFAVCDIAYSANATELTGTIGQLRTANPDVAILIGRTGDALLLIKTMQSAGYKPRIAIGDDAGFSDPAFVTGVGNLAQGIIDRSVWGGGKEGSPAALVNDIFRKKSGRDLDDRSARILQGFFVLAEAIDRAGSSDAAAIQKSLQTTNLKPDQLIVGYNGVHFDGSGQNTLAATWLTQLQGKAYVTVWPPATAAGKLQLPFKGWE